MLERLRGRERRLGRERCRTIADGKFSAGAACTETYERFFDWRPARCNTELGKRGERSVVFGAIDAASRWVRGEIFYLTIAECVEQDGWCGK
jgi:hypothetical protein